MLRYGIICVRSQERGNSKEAFHLGGSHVCKSRRNYCEHGKCYYQMQSSVGQTVSVHKRRMFARSNALIAGKRNLIDVIGVGTQNIGCPTVHSRRPSVTQLWQDRAHPTCL